jgi:peptidoglycan/xylan/chitin deacetylase (PgdA/CDA1 family)
MGKSKDILYRIRRKWTKIRLQPIRVFCFHQVSDTFDKSTMYPGDWTQIEQFKRNILQLKKQYTFISLQDAYKNLNSDWFRAKKYAVLTADDGWSSLKNILPWLYEQHMQITLFVNPAYLKGKETRENGMSGLLTWGELDIMLKQYHNITIASHGWDHTLATDLEYDTFKKYAFLSADYLSQSNQYVPFYAYPCGKHNKQHDDCIKQCALVPVYIDGMKNYSFDGGIHRELLDGMNL